MNRKSATKTQPKSNATKTADTAATTTKQMSQSQADVAAATNQADENTPAFIAKTVTIRNDHFDDAISFAAYNKLKRRQPDTLSGVVREALELYLGQVDDSHRYI